MPLFEKEEKIREKVLGRRRGKLDGSIKVGCVLVYVCERYTSTRVDMKRGKKGGRGGPVTVVGGRSWVAIDFHYFLGYLGEGGL